MEMTTLKNITPAANARAQIGIFFAAKSIVIPATI